jgi:hypothetical protein
MTVQLQLYFTALMVGNTSSSIKTSSDITNWTRHVSEVPNFCFGSVIPWFLCVSLDE